MLTFDHENDVSSDPVIGRVASIIGSRVSLSLFDGQDVNNRVSVGRFVGVATGCADLVGVITALRSEPETDRALHRTGVSAELELVGEFMRDRDNTFRRGVSRYPTINDGVRLLPSSDLRRIYQVSGLDTVEIGSLDQDASLPACVKVQDLLTKHFAVLGTTGVGKSSGVAVILDAVLASRDDVRVFLLDVHNEYASCFGVRASIISPSTLKLPFWLFNLEETADVIYGGRQPIGEEIEILAELIPIAKSKYATYKDTGDKQVVRRAARVSGFTVDTPVPYLLQDLLSLIDERMGRLDNRVSRMHYHRLITRIETIRNDPRYGFMFENANVGGDTMGELLAHWFRLEPEGKPMTIMQLAGLPMEVMDAVVCVLCRLAFEFGIWSEGAVPLLFVCEEAHRYASADRSIGFTPTRRALSRIAREGRKHGVYLGLITQRPAELDPTIISQCSTLFAMRMANERDQAFLAAAVRDATDLLAFVPLLGTGEVIAFGEGVPLPARMKFRELDPDRVPRSETMSHSLRGEAAGSSAAMLGAVVERWRGATMNKSSLDNDQSVARSIEGGPGGILDQTHRRLLRRSLEQGEVAEPARNGGNAIWQVR